jgi:1-pyrroline-5-carboxylate dehydrogenase
VSCDQDALVTALIRGAFEYQGQKCSAASRAYIPKSVWGKIKDSFLDQVRSLKMGPPNDFQNFLCAVIDQKAYKNIEHYIDWVKKDADSQVLVGGETFDSEGYFIRPTVIEASAPNTKTMAKEIFGPVLTVYIYDDQKFEETLVVCDQTSPYALTGAIFANDRKAIVTAARVLRHAAGNFYINDKPTGAIVGQQPFGGARASGTNDKAGSSQNLLRFISIRTVKENFAPPKCVPYPYMETE